MLPASVITESIFCLLATVICSLTGIISLLFSGKDLPSKLLAFSYLSFGYAFGTAALTFSKLLYYLPHLYRTGNIAWLLIMPLSWLYVRATVTKKPLKPLDLLHLLPALLYIIDYFPIFMLSGAEKAALFKIDITNLDKMARYGQGWFLPKDAQLTMRYIQLAAYWYLQVNLLFPAKAARTQIDKNTHHWLKIYTLLELSLFIPFISIKLIGLQDNPWLGTMPAAVAIVLSALTLILHPDILYGQTKPVPPPPKTKPILDPDLARQITLRLEKLMSEDKPFLQPDYTQKELADALGIPPHKLSAFMSHVAGTNFNEYINRWRIRHCLELMRSGEILNLNQHGIAAKCGFNNRQTFSAAYKKVTGQLPSD